MNHNSHESMSYYDSIGLLALCDAIDSVEGIPFRAAAPPRLPPDPVNNGRLNVALPGSYPPVSNSKSAFPQHPLLTHVPPAATSSPSGTMTYAQSQRNAFSQFSGPGHRGDGMPPTLLSQRPNQAPGTLLGRSGADNYGNYPAPPGASSGPPPPSSYTANNGPRPMGAPRMPVSSSSASPTPASGAGGQYRQEECPHCGRLFKGPKASTHKQQHIRRLHPNDYTPKRGGKKRVTDL